ncbi:MAG TPA: bifunctional phosphopantothenoylcysteine decarboxylase/phosphopantothenate--cysteine ligase CoaBC, partial [Hyphomicrobiales bacterium]|nr:bifunctional phosphopantothenoylcysteine decarboxylase/phosphopantothenate--cysteine ligase CoaBC [Hyphomicrobiales bacterium]
EPEEIIAAADKLLSADSARPLQNRNVLVTAGPTFEPIDPVRFIGNRSSGKQGYAIAIAAAKLGARVTLIAGPSGLPDPPGIAVSHVRTAREMLNAVEAALPVDIAIFAAAVSDWRPASVQPGKIKKGGAAPQIKLIENPDILKTIAKRSDNRPALVIGFAAETENVIENATEKLSRKGCDWIVANNVSPASGVFGGERNKVHIVTHSGVESWPAMSKDEVARQLLLAAAAWLDQKSISAQPKLRALL